MLCARPRRSCRRRELLNHPWIGACSQPPLRAIWYKTRGGEKLGTYLPAAWRGATQGHPKRCRAEQQPAVGVPGSAGRPWQW